MRPSIAYRAADRSWAGAGPGSGCGRVGRGCLRRGGAALPVSPPQPPAYHAPPPPHPKPVMPPQTGAAGPGILPPPSLGKVSSCV